MRRLLPLLLLLLSACTVAPAPSPWRLARIRAGEGLYVTVGGRRLCVLDKGRGPAVLLLHGLGGSAYDWRFLMDDIAAAGFRVIVPDMLGAGYSDLPADGDLTPRGQAELMAGLLDALGVRRAHVVGNSYGGGVAVFLAVDYPDRVEKLVLIDAAAVPQDAPFYIGLARTAVLGELVYTIARKEWIVEFVMSGAFYDSSRIREEDEDEYAYESAFHGAKTARLAMARSLEYRGGATLHERLPEIQAPALILWGEHDAITPWESGLFMALAVRNSRLVTLPQCGHVPHMEDPETVKRLVLEFLKPQMNTDQRR